MTRYHNINGKNVAFTAEEETARDTEEANVLAEKTANSYKSKTILNLTSIQVSIPPTLAFNKQK